MKTLITILLALFLSGCVTAPNFDAAEGEELGCWPFGVLENGNTGKMTNVDPRTIRVEKYDYFDLLVMCDQVDYRTLAAMRMDGNTMLLRGCFMPRKVDGKAGEDMIYLYWLAGKKELYEEQCHAALGPKHNNCYPHFGIGKDESACNWDRDA